MVLQNRYVMSSPMKLVEKDLKETLINYNDNPIDRWCLKNTAIQMWDTGHVMPVKVKNKKGKRIDGAVSLIILYEMFRRYRSKFMNNLI